MTLKDVEEVMRLILTECYDSPKSLALRMEALHTCIANEVCETLPEGCLKFKERPYWYE